MSFRKSLFWVQNKKVNLATKLENADKDVNFLLAWNRPHSGDYALNELFEWISEITK